MGEAVKDNIVFLKRFLKIVELASGLQINREKCCIYSLNTVRSWEEEAARILGCRREKLSFKYLGVRVGCAHQKVSDWDYMMKKSEIE